MQLGVGYAHKDASSQPQCVLAAAQVSIHPDEKLTPYSRYILFMESTTQIWGVL